MSNRHTKNEAKKKKDQATLVTSHFILKNQAI